MIVRPKSAWLALLAVPFLLGMAAQEGSGRASFGELLGKIVNFLILFGGLFFLLRRPLSEFLTRRSSDIRTSLDEARACRDAAERKLSEMQARLAALKDETEKIAAEARAGSEKARERIRALADKETERIREFTRQEIELQLKAGIRELAEYTVDLAAALAETRLKAGLSNDAQSKIIDRSIEQLAEIHAEPRPH
jgi:F-type H+-transporting ATPase subunit b